MRVLDEMCWLRCAATATMRSASAQRTTRNFFGPIQTIIPWASNLYTETLIDRARAAFGDDFWGFWMLGGMSGGGMGFIVRAGAQGRGAGRSCSEIMSATKRELQHALPFAMEPVVYDFSDQRARHLRRPADAMATR